MFAENTSCLTLWLRLLTVKLMIIRLGLNTSPEVSPEDPGLLKLSLVVGFLALNLCGVYYFIARWALRCNGEFLLPDSPTQNPRS